MLCGRKPSAMAWAAAPPPCAPRFSLFVPASLRVLRVSVFSYWRARNRDRDRAARGPVFPCSGVVRDASGGQLAQRLVDAGAARFELADRVIGGGRGGARAVDRHLESSEFDHEV